MKITINILYSGTGNNAHKFAEEMIKTGIVERIRAQTGNQHYEYFTPFEDHESILLIDVWNDQAALDTHHKSPMMSEIAKLRDKYKLHMKVTKFQSIN